MSKNLYKDYYEAMQSQDEWKYETAQSISAKIERVREYASWNGISEEEAMDELMQNDDEMGG